ncbi:MAG: hypothetical protein KC609_03155 [Myxococcales bacterium]|nr:hypothetical protein [Myxococcales bacterium]
MRLVAPVLLIVLVVAVFAPTTLLGQESSSFELYHWVHNAGSSVRKVTLRHELWRTAPMPIRSPLENVDLSGHRLQLGFVFTRHIELVLSAAHWQAAQQQGYQLLFGLQYKPIAQLELEIEGRMETFGEECSGTTRLLLDYRLGRHARLSTEVSIHNRHPSTGEPPLITRGHKLQLRFNPVDVRLGYSDSGEWKAGYLRISIKRTRIRLGIRADWSEAGDVTIKFSFQPFAF